MTCAGCEGHIEHAVNKLEGVLEVKASYEQANTIVKFDSSQTTLEEVITAIKSTNYKVGESKTIK
jgi:copper chaperone CopZ